MSYQSITQRERLLAWCDCMDRSRRRAAITLAPREDQPPEYRELADKAARGEISMALAAPLLVEIADRYS